MTVKKKKNKEPQAPKDITLDDLLINIQKSLSRVSNRSSEISEDQAKSLIYGDVDFAIELQVEGNDDKVIVKKDGGVRLTMSGKINTDIRDDSIE